jgi:signal peptide peptidase SppA
VSMLVHIAERVLNRPLLVHPDKLPLVLAVLQGRIPLGNIGALHAEAEQHIDQLPEAAQIVLRGPAPEASRFDGRFVQSDPVTGKDKALPYRRDANGVAMIPVIGSLVNRGAWLEQNSGRTSYEGLRHQIVSAGNDPNTRAILLDIHSPGGEAIGAFETAQAVREAAGKKPVTAVVNGMAASAAYAIASGATRIVINPSGVAGSIGVVMMHADFSRALDKEGVTPTLIFAGAHKVDGHPFAPLPEGVREDLQREVNAIYDQFVQAVAAGRKAMSPAMIRATEARTYIGSDAVDQGLADELGTYESALADLTRGASRSPMSHQPRGFQMEKTTGEPAATAGITQADHDAAVLRASTEGKAAGIGEGRKAERERFAAILASDKIAGRETTAISLALKSPEMTAEDVIAFVAALPAPAPAQAKVPGVAERGAPAVPASSEAKSADAGWNEVVARLNRESSGKRAA